MNIKLEKKGVPYILAAVVLSCGIGFASDVVVDQGALQATDVVGVERIEGNYLPVYLSTEKVDCNEFTCSTNWVKGPNWVFSGGQARWSFEGYGTISPGSKTSELTQDLDVTPGKSYTVEIKIDDFEFLGQHCGADLYLWVANRLVAHFGGSAQDPGSGNIGTWTYDNVFAVDDSGIRLFGGAAGFEGTTFHVYIDYVSVRENVTDDYNDISVNTGMVVDGNVVAQDVSAGGTVTAATLTSTQNISAGGAVSGVTLSGDTVAGNTISGGTLNATTVSTAALTATGTAGLGGLSVSGNTDVQNILVNNVLTVDNITGKTDTVPAHLGNEQVVCWDFSCSTDWILGDHWSISSGQASFIASIPAFGTVNGTSSQNVEAVQGHSYRVEVKLDTFLFSGTSGAAGVTIKLGGTTVAAYDGNSSNNGSGQVGTYVYEHVAPANGSGLLELVGNGGCGPGGASISAKFDYISVKEEVPAVSENLTIDTDTTLDANLNVTGTLTSAILVIPSGTADPANPLEGQMFVNTSENKLKVYSESAWRQVASW